MRILYDKHIALSRRRETENHVYSVTVRSIVVFEAVDGVEGGGETFALLHLLRFRRYAEQVGLLRWRLVSEVGHAEPDQAYGPPRTGRPFAVEEFEHEMAERDVVACRTREGGLARERVEESVAQLDLGRARPAFLAAETPPDVLHQFEQRRPDGLAVAFIFGEGMLARNGFLLGRLVRHAGVVDAEGVVAYRLRRRVAEQARQEAGIGVLQVGAGAVAVSFEKVGGLAAYAPEDPDGFRREEGADAFGSERHDKEPVGLVLLGGDLGEQPVRGESDRTGDAAGGLDLGAELFGERLHAAEEMRRAGHVQKRLIHGDAFDERREAREHLERGIRNFLVHVHARRHEDAVRTFREGGAAGHGGTHAVPPRLVGAGRNDATLMRSRPDDDGFAAPFGMVPLFDRREEGVHIDMQDDHTPRIISFLGRVARAGGILLESMFLPKLNATTPVALSLGRNKIAFSLTFRLQSDRGSGIISFVLPVKGRDR